MYVAESILLFSDCLLYFSALYIFHVTLLMCQIL
jgi:hypothetical protein